LVVCHLYDEHLNPLSQLIAFLVQRHLFPKLSISLLPAAIAAISRRALRGVRDEFLKDRSLPSWLRFSTQQRQAEADQNPRAKAPAAKMPNPNIAKAVASYAGSMNIREYLCVVWPTLVAGRASQTHEIQRPKIYERFGSATRLKAGSHPIGGGESVVTTGDGTVGIFFGASGNRSPLWV
jgi:hypothetical protein